MWEEPVSFVFRDGTAFYYQIKEHLISKIASGEFKIGAKLPSEFQLAEEYGVSRPTVRQAILELVQEGVFSRSRGRGTFVLPPVITSDAHAFVSFAEEMREKGMEHGALLISARTINATQTMAADLDVVVGAPVYEIVRVRMANGEPLVLRTLQVPVALAPNLLERALETSPIYDILKNEYGLIAAGSSQYFSAIAASEEEAALLEINPGDPLGLWRGVTFSSKRAVIARTKAVYRGDRFRFALRQGLKLNDLPSFEIERIKSLP